MDQKLHADTCLARSRQTLLHRQKRAAGKRHGRNLESITSYLSNMRLLQSMYIYLKNGPVKFHVTKFVKLHPLNFSLHLFMLEHSNIAFCF